MNHKRLSGLEAVRIYAGSRCLLDWQPQDAHWAELALSLAESMAGETGTAEADLINPWLSSLPERLQSLVRQALGEVAPPFTISLNYGEPNGLTDRLAEYHARLQTGGLEECRNEALQAFEQLMDELEAGRLSTVSYRGQWEVNHHVKQGLLLGFALGELVSYGERSVDKHTYPLRRIDPSEQIRLVPPAAGLRRGAYAGVSTVFMPPAYVNAGAAVGHHSMAEGLVGSCARVGAHCHLSAGSVIGGVLDPIEASPVILGDHVLLGEGAGVTQGTRLGDRVTVAPGVHISQATPVLDPLRGRAYTSEGTFELEYLELGPIRVGKVGTRCLEPKAADHGPVIPRGALVIPGMTVSSFGTFKPTPQIARYLNTRDEQRYALEATLRERVEARGA